MAANHESAQANDPGENAKGERGEEQSGGEAGHHHDATSDSVPADAKEKMRQALNRKKEAERPAAEGISHTGTIHGSEVAGGEGKKIFRRKTG